MPTTRSTRLAFSFIALSGLAFAGCASDVGGVTNVRGEVEASETLDFGDVQRGIKLTLELTIKNAGNGALQIERIEIGDNFTTADYEFKVPESGFALGAAQEKALAVSFQPFADQAEAVTSFFTLVYNCDAQGECERFTVTLSGRGVSTGLRIEPEPVDFGTVLIGSSRTLDVMITNTLSVPVDVATRVDANGRAELTNMGGLGRFELLSPITPNGSLLVDRDPLAPNETLTVQVRYVPDPGQEDEQDRGRWVISNCDNPLCDRKIDLLGKGTNAAIECMPATIDFGDVNPGATTTLSTRCRNVASETVAITGWRLEAGSASEFQVENYDGTPSALPPNTEFEVEVAFSPTLANVGRMLQGGVVITGRNPRANRDLAPTRVPLVGTAGGPDISVTPPALNFGQIALGTTGRRRILVENVGYSDLTVSEIRPDLASTGVFSVDRTAFTIPRGGSEIIEVSFSPVTEGAISSQLLIVSDDADERELTINLDGNGVDLPPCSFNLLPTAINFGIVQVLRPSTQGFTIENIGAADCLVNDIAMAPGSDPAFRLVAGDETGVRIPAGMSKQVIVEYTPGTEGTHTGSIPFYISNPMNSNPEVTLRGVGSSSALLISPNEMDFGQVGLNCSTRARTITIYNTGSQTTRIDDILLPAGVSSEFSLSSVPNGIPAPPGASIQPGQSIEFTITYRASDISVDSGFLHILENGRTDPYVVPLYGEGSKNPVNEDRFTQLETPEVDILFVIDNSCSMSDEQASLTGNFQSFIQFADAQALDYQIAVVSTDVDGGFGAGCTGGPNRPGTLDQGACGYFADGSGDNGPSNPDWRIITPDEQPSPEIAFTAIATQGTSGSGSERGLEAAFRALSAPIITGWNTGFLRRDAYLALIFVSDEEDQSQQSVDFYVNFFRAIKGFRNTNLFSASSIVLGPNDGCGSASNTGNRYIDTSDRTGGIFESICTQDWASALQNLGLSVFGYKSRFFLSNQPVAGSVEVWVDGVKIEPQAGSGQVRWQYEASGNSVNFAPLAIPEPGSEIVVRYLAECL